MSESYENSIFYIIHSCAKCFDKLFVDLLKQADAGLTSIEMLALGVIAEKNGCSQRDLARIILKDRANTGKIALSLEKKGMIKISLKTKNNRPSKILSATNKGLKLCTKLREIANPFLKKIIDEVSYSQINKAKETLKTLKTTVENTVKFDI